MGWIFTKKGTTVGDVAAFDERAAQRPAGAREAGAKRPADAPEAPASGAGEPTRGRAERAPEGPEAAAHTPQPQDSQGAAEAARAAPAARLALGGEAPRPRAPEAERVTTFEGSRSDPRSERSERSLEGVARKIEGGHPVGRRPPEGCPAGAGGGGQKMTTEEWARPGPTEGADLRSSESDRQVGPAQRAEGISVGVVPTSVSHGKDDEGARGRNNIQIRKDREIVCLHTIFRAGPSSAVTISTAIFPEKAHALSDADEHQVKVLLRDMVQNNLLDAKPAPVVKCNEESMSKDKTKKHSNPPRENKRQFIYRLTAKGSRYLHDNHPNGGVDAFGNSPLGHREQDSPVGKTWMHHNVAAQYLLIWMLVHKNEVIFETELRRYLGGSINLKVPDGLRRPLMQSGWLAVEVENSKKRSDDFAFMVEIIAKVFNDGHTDIADYRVESFEILRVENKTALTPERLTEAVSHRILTPATLTVLHVALSKSGRIRSTREVDYDITPGSPKTILNFTTRDLATVREEIEAAIIATEDTTSTSELTEIVTRTFTYHDHSGTVFVQVSRDEPLKMAFQLKCQGANILDRAVIEPCQLLDLEKAILNAMAWGTPHGRKDAENAYKRAVKASMPLRWFPKLDALRRRMDWP